MRRARRLLGCLLAAVVATGCAVAAAPLASGPGEPPLALANPDSEAELGQRLIGRWEGEVDMTMSERTLVIGAVRRHEGRGRVEARYGRHGAPETDVRGAEPELPELGYGSADLNRDGIVALQELYEYLEREVTRKSRAAGGNQHPVLKGELEGMLSLVQIKP